jgi:prepilin-type processing-associated H-X9-DG protein
MAMGLVIEENIQAKFAVCSFLFLDGHAIESHVRKFLG